MKQKKIITYFLYARHRRLLNLLSVLLLSLFSLNFRVKNSFPSLTCFQIVVLLTSSLILIELVRLPFDVEVLSFDSASL